jgi:hypothetical protein
MLALSQEASKDVGTSPEVESAWNSVNGRDNVRFEILNGYDCEEIYKTIVVPVVLHGCETLVSY